MTGAAAHDDSGGSVDSIGQVEKVESDYYAFMGFDRANAESVLSHYPAFFDDGPVLELACGPGVFLDLLAARGIAAAASTSMTEWSQNAGPRDTTWCSATRWSTSPTSTTPR